MFPGSSRLALAWAQWFTAHVHEVHVCCLVHDVAYELCVDQATADQALHRCLCAVDASGWYRWMVADAFTRIVQLVGHYAHCRP